MKLSTALILGAVAFALIRLWQSARVLKPSP